MAETSQDLRLEELTKRFGDFVAVDDLDADRAGGLVLRAAGPVRVRQDDDAADGRRPGGPDRGRILIGDEDITDLRPYKRPVNTVFQSYALFPHLTIFENVAFGLRRRGVKDYKQKTHDMLELVAAGRRTPPASRPSCPAASSSGSRSAAR